MKKRKHCENNYRVGYSENSVMNIRLRINCAEGSEWCIVATMPLTRS